MTFPPPHHWRRQYSSGHAAREKDARTEPLLMSKFPKNLNIFPNLNMNLTVEDKIFLIKVMSIRDFWLLMF